MGNGKNERSWYWVDGQSYSFTPLTFIATGMYEKEPVSVLKTAPTLYFLKEGLKKTGWEVVSCSYRTDATGSTLFPGVGYYPIQSATYGQNIRNNPASQVQFAVTGADMWITASTEYFTDSYFANNEIPVNEMHRLIYPCNQNITSSGIGDSSHLVSSSVGRSWILLKNTNNGLKQYDNGEDLYLVLDYASAHYHATTTATSSVITVDNVNAGGARQSFFGHSINIAYFYGPPQNITPATPFIRPYAEDELSFAERNVVTSPRLSNNGEVIINPTTYDTVNINTVYNAEYGGSYTYITENAAPRYIFGIDRMSDSLSSNLSTKADVGRVVFMCFSTTARGNLNFLGTKGSDLFMLDRYQAYTPIGGTNAYDDGWGTDHFYRPLKYFKDAPPNGTHVDAELFSTIPMYQSNNQDNQRFTGVLGYTLNNASTTIDGTYLEYPLPLLDNTSPLKLRYAGRFADVKLGPAAGFNGSMGRTDLSYDRLLLGGIWFPFSSSAPPDL